MYIKNITQGPKSVNTPDGSVTLEAGEVRDNLNLSEGEAASASATGWFSFTPEAEDAGDGADLSGAEREELNVLRVEVADLRQQLADALAAKEAPDASDEAETPDTPERLYEARDTGSGWWTIFDQDENAVGSKVRKDVAEAFNGKSDDEKAAFVAEHTAAQD